MARQRKNLVREAIQEIIPCTLIEELVRELGVEKRSRLCDPVELVVHMLLVGGTAEAGRIAAVLRDYFQSGKPRTARSAAYRWFDEEMLAVLERLVEHARQHVLAMPPSLPGILAGRRDWRLFDSSTVKLPDALATPWPGAGDYAALKIHAEYSLGVENVVDYSIGPAREHDGPKLVIDERRSGTGILVDLGYASHDLIRRCEQFDVAFVIRGKTGWNLYLDDSVPTEQAAEWILPEGWRPTDPADGAIELPPHGELDIDVTLGPESDPLFARLVCFSTDDGTRVVLLTNVPRSSHKLDEVGMLYRLRWGIEIGFKVSKTGCQLDEITARKPVSALIMVHASMIATMLANAVCHAAHVEDGGRGTRAPRMSRPPVHPLLVWKLFASPGGDWARRLRSGMTDAEWRERTALLVQLGGDPNWRSRPSALDEVKGRVPNRRPWRSGKPMLSKPRRRHSRRKKPPMGAK